MRYEHWDVLLFPWNCKVPFKEFGTSYHVVQDPESAFMHDSYGLPTVCCFVPSSQAGSPFQVSLHSWGVPAISQFTKAFTKFAGAVRFEARLLIDGSFIASTILDRKSPWPQVLARGKSLSPKSNDCHSLQFPKFHEEVLQQQFWSPADNYGRIKVILSEVFIRDSPSLPVERVKNLVAFSFQHAPLCILQSSSIAWPNQLMWHRAYNNAFRSSPSNVINNHAHSPRSLRAATNSFASGNPLTCVEATISSQSPQTSGRRATFPESDKQPAVSSDPSDTLAALMPSPWACLTNEDAVKSRGRPRTSTDISMPDYASTGSGYSITRTGRSPAPAVPGALSKRQDTDNHTSMFSPPIVTAGTCEKPQVIFNDELSQCRSFWTEQMKCLREDYYMKTLLGRVKSNESHLPGSQAL